MPQFQVFPLTDTCVHTCSGFLILCVHTHIVGEGHLSRFPYCMGWHVELYHGAIYYLWWCEYIVDVRPFLL